MINQPETADQIRQAFQTAGIKQIAYQADGRLFLVNLDVALEDVEKTGTGSYIVDTNDEVYK
jgi:hypothetical protein